MSTEEVLTSPLCTKFTEGDRPPLPAPLPNHGDTKPDIILPRWIYIKDRHGRYLSVRSGPKYATLTFRYGDPDLNCAFETERSSYTGSFYKLTARGGNRVVRYYIDPGWYSADEQSPSFVPSFGIITATGDKVYLKDTYGFSRFLTDELKDTGAPIGHDYVNESSLMEILQAAIKNEIIDIKYDIPSGVVSDADPIVALSTSVRNDSEATVEQTLTYTYEKWSVGTWNNTAGIEIGAKATFSAGVPFVANAEFEISVSASFSHSWGGEDGTRQVVSSSTTVIVPAKKKARATVIIKNARIDVGFTYTQRIYWSNGQSEDTQKTGVYKNVDSWHVDVVLDHWEDVPP